MTQSQPRYRVFISKRGRMRVQERGKPGRGTQPSSSHEMETANPDIGYVCCLLYRCLYSPRSLLVIFVQGFPFQFCRVTTRQIPERSHCASTVLFGDQRLYSRCSCIQNFTIDQMRFYPWKSQRLPSSRNASSKQSASYRISKERVFHVQSGVQTDPSVAGQVLN